MCQSYTGVCARIRTIWGKQVESQWTRDNSALESARLLLASEDTSYIFPLTPERQSVHAVSKELHFPQIICTCLTRRKSHLLLLISRTI